MAVLVTYLACNYYYYYYYCYYFLVKWLAELYLLTLRAYM